MIIRRDRNLLAALFATAALLFGAHSANAVLIGGVEFPEGAVSFADAVVDYAVGAGRAVVSND